MDNNGYKESILLTFGNKVTLSSVDINWSGSQNGYDGDISVLAFTGSGNPMSTSYNSIATALGNANSGWKLIGNYANTSQNVTPSVSLNTSVSASYWLVAAYNSIFATNNACKNATTGAAATCNDSDDYIKLYAVAGTTGGGGKVPEPSALLLFGTGLMGLVGHVGAQRARRPNTLASLGWTDGSLRRAVFFVAVQGPSLCRANCLLNEPVNLASDSRPLVVHVMHRFDVGGLENGVVNLINHMPADAYRHAIMALTEVTDFRKRITARRCPVHQPEQAARASVSRCIRACIRIFRELRPAIVHTRNLAALEVTVPAWAAGVPVRIHGEHGRDVGDLDGSNRTVPVGAPRLQPLRHPLTSPCRAIWQATWSIGSAFAPRKVDADLQRRRCRALSACRRAPSPIAGCPFDGPDHWLVGTVGRMQTVKDQTLLARAFVRALEIAPALKRAPAPGHGRRRPVARRSARPARRAGVGRSGLAARRAPRRAGNHARARLLCPALAGRRHFQHHPRSHGVGLAGDRHATSAATPNWSRPRRTGELVPAGDPRGDGAGDRRLCQRSGTGPRGRAGGQGGSRAALQHGGDGGRISGASTIGYYSRSARPDEQEH